MRRRLVAVWALIVLPFVGTAAMGGPGGHLGGNGAAAGTLLPHAVFHPVYIVFAIGAILVLLSLRSATDFRIVRAVAVALVLAQAAVVAGMFGEEIAVLRNGGLSAGQEIFAAPLGYTSGHFYFATFLTFPGLFGSLILLVVLTIAALLAMRTTQRPT
jgi:hypothetical protein